MQGMENRGCSQSITAPLCPLLCHGLFTASSGHIHLLCWCGVLNGYCVDSWSSMVSPETMWGSVPKQWSISSPLLCLLSPWCLQGCSSQIFLFSPSLPGSILPFKYTFLECQNAIVSDQLPLAILYMDNVMFNIKFTYLKTGDVM